MSARPPKILHGFNNIGGIPQILSAAERMLGFDSRAICFPSGPYQRQADETIDKRSLGLFFKALHQFDIFNFHFGQSLLGAGLYDLPLLRLLGKKVFLHFHGCDIRDSAAVIARGTVSACQHCAPRHCSANRVTARRAAERYANAVFVTTPDIVEFVTGSVWLPQAVDDERLYDAVRNRPIYEPAAASMRVLHAPSEPSIKGTRFLEEAVARLHAEGVPIELKVLHGVPHADVVAAIFETDIVVDQLLLGAYGIVAVEAMLLGKPVVVHIRDDLRPMYGDELSVVTASPTDIADRLRWLSENRSTWKGLGARGRQYALRHHAATQVAAKLSRHYSETFPA